MEVIGVGARARVAARRGTEPRVLLNGEPPPGFEHFQWSLPRFLSKCDSPLSNRRLDSSRGRRLSYLSHQGNLYSTVAERRTKEEKNGRTRRKNDKREAIERKKGHDKEEESNKLESSGDFSSAERIRSHVSRLVLRSNVRSVFSSGFLGFFFLCSPRCLYAVRSSVYTHGGLRVRPPAPRRDRDAKETRAAFKLAATKRINSPGSLDLLIRAGVAFLRGLDRWALETPRPSCFLATTCAT